MNNNLPPLCVLNRPQILPLSHSESDIAQPARFRSFERTTGMVLWIISFPKHLSFFLMMRPKHVIFLFLTDLSRCLSVPAYWSTHLLVIFCFHEIRSKKSQAFHRKGIYSCLICFSQGPAFTSILAIPRP